MKHDRKYNIIVVENHAIVKAGIEYIVNSMEQFQLIASSSDGIEGLKFIQEKKPDIAIIDISLPSLTGISIVRELNRSGQKVKIVILTRHDYLPYLISLLQLGISAYILKDNAAEELKIALNTVVQGGQYISPAIQEIKDRFDNTSATIDSPTQVASNYSLTIREKEILKLIGEGCQNTEIAKKLSISTNTVRVHRNHISHKLGAHGTKDLIAIAKKSGL